MSTDPETEGVLTGPIARELSEINRIEFVIGSALRTFERIHSAEIARSALMGLTAALYMDLRKAKEMCETVRAREDQAETLDKPRLIEKK